MDGMLLDGKSIGRGAVSQGSQLLDTIHALGQDKVLNPAI